MTRTRVRPWLQGLLCSRFVKQRPTPLLRLELEVLEDRLAPATLLVNTNADVVNPADGTLSLRDAISAVNAGNANGLTAVEKGQVSGTFGVNDMIEFSSALHGGTITLNGSALPEITESLTITGLGASNLAISGNHQSGVFSVAGNTTVGISGLTIENGNATNGGGIANRGTLTVSNCTLAGNSAQLGGGIYSAENGRPGSLVVSNSTFTGNSAGDGGGIYNTGSYGEAGGFVTVINSTLANNSATSNANVGGDGGGIFDYGALLVINSTLADNSATSNTVGYGYGFGGGIFVPGSGTVGGTLFVSNSTIAGNSASHGGGIAYTETAGPATLNNTIVANSVSGGDLFAFVTGSNDLIGDGFDLRSLTNSLQGNPLLVPLGDYGGPTQTLALLSGSPALDAGSVALAVDANGNPLTTDQRGVGFPRVINDTVDIGAFEGSLSFDKLGSV